MGRILLFLLLLAGALAMLDTIGLSALDPRGVGTRLDGRQVIRDAGPLEASFTRVGSLDDTYMLFGGDVTRQRNSLNHAFLAGLPLHHARAIAASHPDFHLCKSPGASQAQKLTQDLNVVAADRAARNALEEAVELYEERLHGSGERTCVRVQGAPLSLDSVRLQEGGADVTEQVTPAFARARIVLAERVAIEDCATLLR